MRTPGATVIAATAVLMVVGIAACTPDDGPTPTPTPTPDASTTAPTSSPTPTPSLTPSPSPTPSPTPAENAARNALLDYIKVLNKITQDPQGEDPNDLRRVAGGELLSNWIAEAEQFRARGWHATGPLKVKNLRVGAVTTSGGTSTVQATYCADVTGVDVVDRDGKSVVNEDRPDRTSNKVWLEKKKGGDWLPIRSRNEGDACDA